MTTTPTSLPCDYIKVQSPNVLAESLYSYRWWGVQGLCIGTLQRKKYWLHLGNRFTVDFDPTLLLLVTAGFNMPVSNALQYHLRHHFDQRT